jgi:DNA polymerase V
MDRHASSQQFEIIPVHSDGLSPLLLFADEVAAGFPSPAQDYVDGKIDLNRELVAKPESTFCVRARGDSMVDDDITNGDILVVDRSVTPYDGCLAVCLLDGAFTVKRVLICGDHIELRPANVRYSAIRVTAEQSFEVWGVVTWVLHRKHGRA